MKLASALFTLTGSLCAAVFLAGCASAPAPTNTARGGSATVTFVQPEKYTDLQRTDTTIADSRPVLLSDLEGFIRSEAARSLPAGRQLDMRILDIDQAGWMRPAGYRTVRVVTDSRPARVEFEYRLADAAGATLKSGKETLTGIPGESSQGARDTDELALVKQLLRDWIRRLGR